MKFLLRIWRTRTIFVQTFTFIKKLATIFCLLLLSSILAAQSTFEGKWEGTLSQNPGGIYSDYKYELELKVSKNYVSGVSRVSADGVSCRMKLKGQIIGNVLVIEEFEYLDPAEIPSLKAEWCTKIGKLQMTVRKGVATLTGPMTAKASFGDCPPAVAKLSRPMLRA